MKTAPRALTKVRHSPMEHPIRQYQQETQALQDIAKSCGLTEEIKWGKPCFTFNQKNIVLIQRFNNYIALLFFKGALLHDPEGKLWRIGEHTQVPRQLRFSNVAEITEMASIVRRLIGQAVELEKSGARAQRRPANDLAIPSELTTRLNADPMLKSAFAALTPGRRKGYILQIAAAKQSPTRASRVEKYAPRILAGKGLHDS